MRHASCPLGPPLASIAGRMKLTHTRKDTIKLLIAVMAFTAVAASCGKKRDGSLLGAYGADQEFAAYEAHCITDPPLPPPPPGTSGDPRMAVALPDNLPRKTFPIEINQCSALRGEPPRFAGREMPAFTVSVDCNSNLVRFRTREWQVAEAAAINPQGQVDAKIMMINRMLFDAEGNENCWMRFLAHITGSVDCGGGAANAHANLKVVWTMDETPPEIMEPPSPGHADLRNGKHCVVRPGNCQFTNNVSLGCNG